MSPLFYANYAKLAIYASVDNYVLDFIIMFYAILDNIGNYDSYGIYAFHVLNNQK